MNLASLIAEHPADRIAFIDASGPVSYGELRDTTAKLRFGLLSKGLQAGDRLALVCGNTRNFVFSYLAALGAGIIVVPLNPLSPGAELQRELDMVGARATIFGPAGASAMADIDRQALPSLEFLYNCGAALDGSEQLDSLIGDESSPVVDVEPDHLAALIFTSGTAGFPKAAQLSHGNLEVNQRQTLAQAPDGFLAVDVAYCVIPLFHIFGLNTVLGTSLRQGATVVLVQRFDPMSLVEAVAQHQITLLVGPPTFWHAIASLPEVEPSDFASVRVAISGAAKLPERVSALVTERLGLTIYEGYGMTESSPSLTSALHTDAPRGSVGRPVPAVELRIVDAIGDDVLIGDAGEIIARGPNIFSGYWDDPEATARAIDDDGWLHTGDIAVVNDDGYISIIDRAKDLIIVSGFNVYPAEVEAVIAEHESVQAVAVVGVPHPHTDEAVRAVVVLYPGASIEEDELVAFARTQLASYKCPSKVDVVDELPVGFGGKLRRQDLATE